MNRTTEVEVTDLRAVSEKVIRNTTMNRTAQENSSPLYVTGIRP